MTAPLDTIRTLRDTVRALWQAETDCEVKRLLWAALWALSLICKHTTEATK